MPHDLRPLLAAVRETVDAHATDDGGFAARPGGGHADPYGCADALNLAWTLGSPLTTPRWRAVGNLLAGLQDPETGLWTDPTHHPFHTTAHCAAALELLDRRPSHPLRTLHELLGPGALEAFLDALDWHDQPWTESHQGAGVWAAMTLAGEAPAEWTDRYFRWLADECDPGTGLWRRGTVDPPPGWQTSFPQLAGTFHYLFNHLAAGRPIPHPAALLATALDQLRTEAFPWATFAGFAEVDVVYCIHRCAAATGRLTEVQGPLADFADRFVPFARALDLADPDGAGDLHLLFGVVCCLTELQLALPGEIESDAPLRLVLDRRPFI